MDVKPGADVRSTASEKCCILGKQFRRFWRSQFLRHYRSKLDNIASSVISCNSPNSWEGGAVLESAECYSDGRGFRFQQRQLWKKPIAWALIAAVAYYCGCRLGFAFTFNPRPISILWPPNAILMSALLLVPRRNWPLVLVLVFAAHVVVQLGHEVPLSMVLCWYVSNSVEALIGAATVLQVLKRPLRFQSTHETWAFLLYAVLMAPFLSAFVDVSFVKSLGWGEGTYWELWQTRFMSNTTATLAIVPLSMCCAEWFTVGRPEFKRRGGVEFALLVAGLIATCLLAFNAAPPDALRPFLLYLPIPFLIWAALRFGPFGSSTGFVLVCGAVIWGASHGRGPFVAGSPVEVDVMQAQLLLQLVGTFLLFLASGVRERAVADAQLTHISRVVVLGELTASIAHEISQPLAAISLNANTVKRLLAQQPIPADEIAGALADIHNDSARAGEVISHLRSLIRRRELSIEHVSINRIIENVLTIVQFDLNRHDIIVRTQLAELPAVCGDAIHLQQVLLNLILNAVDAMKEPCVGERILQVTSINSSNRRVCVSVLDSGPGFSPESAERLFDAFYTTKKEGTGVGLAIARTIIELHGGSIHAENNRLRGARFYFFLPVAIAV
jgi:signal transduction histidine kinase